MDDKILKEVRYIKADGEPTLAVERVVRETALTVVVDGRHFVTSMILAAMEEEYVVGYLYTQGLIHNAADILSLVIHDHVAEVTLDPSREKRAIPHRINSTLVVRKEDVFTCVRAILKSPVFDETEAVHSAGIFLNGNEAIAITEDLGRHNALDKVIGASLLKNIDFAQTLAASTGRQPAEMILKCRSAGIPLIATKGVPTSVAVEMAEEAGITIAGLVRGNTMTIYSHPERIQ